MRAKINLVHLTAIDRHYNRDDRKDKVEKYILLPTTKSTIDLSNYGDLGVLFLAVGRFKKCTGVLYRQK